LQCVTQFYQPIFSYFATLSNFLHLVINGSVKPLDYKWKSRKLWYLKMYGFYWATLYYIISHCRTPIALISCRHTHTASDLSKARHGRDMFLADFGHGERIIMCRIIMWHLFNRNIHSGPSSSIAT